MGTDRWQRIEDLFSEAAARESGERAAFLASACGEDEELRQEVESLLAADGASGRFLSNPARPRGAAAPESLSLSHKRIGHYRVESTIGAGGMSTVYLAVRADDVYQQKVALKVLGHGVDRPDLIARFRIERQILASLDHPGIARLLDGGTTDDGRPYLVMEYIEGKPLDEYCDLHRLGLDERIDLFRKVCSAVEYAHQNLVVHRDIKPSNILVTSEGNPRLLDFGIAKLLEGAALPGTIEATVTGQRLMTPQYASPEQVEGGPVTTSSDVYSLGVVLYALLTGRLPYRLQAKRGESLERAVVEQDAERPSTAVGRTTRERGIRASDRIADEGPTVESLSEARGLRPVQLRRKLSGDLDNILLMALRKEPSRRYASVGRLSEDLRRYREGEVVTARRDTFGYRAGKFVRRHKVAVGAAATVFAVIIGLAATMTAQAVRLARQRDEISTERDKAVQVRSLLEDIFEGSDPEQSRGETVTARELLDKGAVRVMGKLRSEPETQAALALTIGKVYLSLGLHDRAEPLLRQSLSQREQLHGPDHADVAESLQALAVLDQDRGDLASAESHQRRALAIQRRTLGDRDRKVGDTLTDLSVTLLGLARYADAEGVIREALEIHRSVPGDDEAVAYDLNNLASVLRRSGRLEEAERVYRDALAVARKVFGPAHPQLTRTINNLAVTLMDRGNLASAEPLMREALAMTRKLYGSEHPDVALQLSNLASMLGARGDLDGWIDNARQALEMRRKLFGPEHEQVAMSLDNLGRALAEKRDLEGARRLYEEALRIQRKVYGEEHPRVADVLLDMAELTMARGDRVEAERLARAAVKIRVTKLGEKHADVGWSWMVLGSIRHAAGSDEEAEALLRRGLEVLMKALPPGHWRTGAAMSELGACLTARGGAVEGERLLQEGYEILARSRPASPRTKAALVHLIAFYEGRGDASAAAGYRARLAR